MSSPEWSAYLRDQLGVERDVEEINRDVVGRIERLYHYPSDPDALALAAASVETIGEVTPIAPPRPSCPLRR